jgi:predicted secreted Zn-dependent protease
MIPGIPSEVQLAWDRYQAKIRTLEERRRAVFAREDARSSADSLARLRSKLGLT